MEFAAFRASRGITLEQCALELDLAASSRGWLSEIENGKKDASLRLALRIERWSEGAVTAASVCAELRTDKPGSHGTDPLVDDPATMATLEGVGAEKTGANISRTRAGA